MITQTLEWHRFEERQPIECRACLMCRLLDEEGIRISLPRVVLAERSYANIINDSARLSWWRHPNGGVDIIALTDLWAYWSEPKEEK